MKKYLVFTSMLLASHAMAQDSVDVTQSVSDFPEQTTCAATTSAVDATANKVINDLKSLGWSDTQIMSLLTTVKKLRDRNRTDVQILNDLDRVAKGGSARLTRRNQKNPLVFAVGGLTIGLVVALILYLKYYKPVKDNLAAETNRFNDLDAAKTALLGDEIIKNGILDVLSGRIDAINAANTAVPSAGTLLTPDQVKLKKLGAAVVALGYATRVSGVVPTGQCAKLELVAKTTTTTPETTTPTPETTTTTPATTTPETTTPATETPATTTL